MNFIYRDAIPDDMAACLDLRGKTRENAISVEELKTAGVTLESLQHRVSTGSLLGYVCLFDNKIVGYCMGDKNIGRVVVLALLPEYENKGIGKTLLNKMAECFKSLGFTRIFLGCSPDQQVRSYRFYRHLGWQSTGTFDHRQDEILEYFFP